MAWGVSNTEHAGAKKAAGFWGVKSYAKRGASKGRRAADKRAVRDTNA